MSARTYDPRFEVVHTGPHKFHARLRWSNGEIGWTTETYKRRRAAIEAIALLHAVAASCEALPLREVDERTFPPLGDTL